MNGTQPTTHARNSKASWRALRERLAAIKAENETVPETHDWNEDATRRLIIDLALQRAGWPLEHKDDREYEVTGMPNASEIGYADYVLWGDDGKPLAVVEAKKTTVDPAVGRQQAKLYADCLEAMHGQRPDHLLHERVRDLPVGRPGLRAASGGRLPQERMNWHRSSIVGRIANLWTWHRSRTPSSSATTRSGPSGASANTSHRRGARRCW